NDSKSDAIVKTILMLGENLGIEVVAEGVETVGQLEMLQKMGCKLGQGFLFSRPVEARVAESLLRQNRAAIINEQALDAINDDKAYEFTAIQ
ncbi:EAL domain-containing protein, partial [Escherichia coli]|nr:EAL domain-containing protein [Escherichia coli]